MTVAMAEITALGGWWLVVPLGLASLAIVAAGLSFLRRSRGRRLVPAEPTHSDPGSR